MKLSGKLAWWLVVLVVIGLGVAALKHGMHVREQGREAGCQTALADYSRNLRPGATREEVEQFIRRHGAHSEADTEPDSPGSRDVLVQLGENPPPLYCSRRVTYLQLKFDEDDRFRNASLKEELQDCM